MHSLQKQFHDFIHVNQLIDKDVKVLLAVSGGLDSMVMASLFKESNFSFAVAHCNFGLRGKESDGDEALVAEWAKKNDVKIFVKTFTLKKKSIQLEARDARYEWFGELCDEHNFDKLATAHHLNDSLETTLINLSRGTGINGLTGVPIQNGNIIRPLLFARKKSLQEFAKEFGLEWREDASNEKRDYSRNRVRHEVIPQLLKINPSLLDTFKLSLERFQYTSDIVKQRVQEVKMNYLNEIHQGFCLDLDWIKSSSDELILAEVLSSFGANYITAKEVFEAVGKSGKTFPLQDWEITMDRSSLFITQLRETTPQEFEIDLGESQITGGKMVVEEVGKEQAVFDSSNVAYLDADKISFPLKLRSWSSGDKFQPLGMKGEKMVSDFLIDAKVPLVEKKMVNVLESAGRIVWLVGMRISDAFKLSEQSKRILKVTIIKRDS